MAKQGYMTSKSDSCLYVKSSGRDKTYVLLYVDDILYFGSNDSDILQLKITLNKEFKMKDMGLISSFLGINVKQDIETGVTELDQSSYLKSILKRFNMENCKDMLTPMDPNINTKIFENLNKPVNKQIEKLRRKIIGCLMYAAMGTRPDLCFPVSMLSRYQGSANTELLCALKRVLRYVKYSLNYKLIYKCEGVLEGYCDADWGGDLKDRKSTSGYLFLSFNCLVLWCSRKQASVSLSSTEAEYVSISMAASDAIWLIKLLSDFDIEIVFPTHIYSDNQSAIINAKTDSIKRLKHVDIRYHFVKDLIKNKQISIHYIKTSEQPADILTKALSKELITRHLKKCGIVNTAIDMY